MLDSYCLFLHRLLSHFLSQDNKHAHNHIGYLYLSIIEYPLDYKNTSAKTLMKWGIFKAEDIHLSILGQNNAVAVKLFDQAGWE